MQARLVMSHAVQLFVYDLSKGLARQLSQGLLGQRIEGIWHTSVVVYEQEFYFGGMGIESCPPCGTILGPPEERIDLGSTDVPADMFYEYLSQLGEERFRPERYHLFDHNCNNFSAEAAHFLTGRDIPSHITNLPNVVLQTPMGQMLRSIMENTRVTPSSQSTTRRF